MRFLFPTVALSIMAISVMAFIAMATPIQAHFQSYDSVNGDCEIRYEETQYGTALVAGEFQWETIKESDNCVNIKPDNSKPFHGPCVQGCGQPERDSGQL